MRRALVPISILGALAAAALAAPASAQVYDRYGGGAANAMPPWYQPPARVLSWSGKQAAQAPPVGYPQQAYPQQGYPQQAFPQQGYPPQAYQPQPYQQQGYYPSIRGVSQQQEQMPPYREGPLQGMPTYEQMQEQKARAQVAQPPQPFPIMNTPPQGAWAYQPGAYPQQQPYPQQQYPQQAYPQQPYAAPVAYPQPQPQQFPGQPYPQAAQPMMAAPAAAPYPADPSVMAAPTTPVQSQPLPTNIYAPAAPRADIQPGMPSGLPPEVQGQPSGGAGSTALASLDYRGLPANDPRSLGVRHYSVHRPFGMNPDPAPIPPVDNQVIIAQSPEAEMVDNSVTGLRGVGVEQDAKRSKSDD